MHAACRRSRFSFAHLLCPSSFFSFLSFFWLGYFGRPCQLGQFRWASWLISLCLAYYHWCGSSLSLWSPKKAFHFHPGLFLHLFFLVVGIRMRCAKIDKKREKEKRLQLNGATLNSSVGPDRIGIRDDWRKCASLFFIWREGKKKGILLKGHRRP